MLKEILHKKLCYDVTGVCFKVQGNLGRFCRERQYADEFERLLIENGIKYEREFSLDKLESNNIKGNRVDFIINKLLLIDFKAKKFINKNDYIQM